MPIRVLVGPLLVALASWCAAGLITVPDPDRAAVRLALPAPWWVPVTAFLIALAIPAWRRHPMTAVPALVSTLPWWPVPLPSIALLWTGPIAWAPILAALLCAIARSWPRTAVLAASSPRADAVRAGAVTLLVAAIAAVSLAPRLPGGDEPHYLIITESLLYDADLEIGNNHEARDYAAYYGGDLRPDLVQRGQAGEVYSIHAPGVSAVVLPGFALAGYRGAQATVMLLAAIGGALIWAIGWAATRSRGAAWFAWAAVAITPTFLIQSVTIFPDGPAALIVAAATLALLRMRTGAARLSTRALVVISVLLAALPWLHTRLAIIAVVFGLALVWTLTRETGTHRLRRLAAFAVVPLSSAVAWLAYFYALYGTIDPTAPYGTSTTDRSWTFAPGGIAGLLFDQQFGVVAYSPVLLFGAVGLARAVRGGTTKAAAIASLSAAVAYLAVTGTYWMWWAGVPAPPARFMMAVLPVLALPLAVAWARVARAGRLVAGVALAGSMAITACVILVERGALAWNIRDAQALWLNWLTGVVNLPRGWPSFFWQLTPAEVATEWPFALHVIVWVASVAAIGWGAVRLARMRLSTEMTFPVLALLAGGMAIVQIGWTLAGVSGLDPARSQLRMLGQMVQGRRPVTIGNTSTPTGELPPIVVHPEEAPRFRPELLWAFFANVPPGDYAIRVRSPRAEAGELIVRYGRGPEERAAYSLAAVMDQTVTLSLPAGARALTMDVDPRMKEAGARVELQRR